MPLSAEAFAGLQAAVEWNPYAAWQLLGILRETPALVRHKPEDRYGPLGFMLAALPRRRIAPGVSLPVQPEPLSPEQLAACAAFNDGWLRREFTKRELAEAIAVILERIAPGLAEEPPAGSSAVLYRRPAN